MSWKWFMKYFHHSEEQGKPNLFEEQQFLSEIREAQRAWEIAQLKLNYVTEKDQIDYAIYAIEAAQKRYEMLLRQAKKRKLQAPEPGKVMKVK